MIKLTFSGGFYCLFEYISRMSQINQKQDQDIQKLPKGVYYIVGNEFAERFSFYGLKSLLILFLAKQFLIPEGNYTAETAKAAAREEVHYFIFLAYFLPIVGGLLSDWFLGKYKTIFWLSLVCCVGHLILAFNTHDHLGFLLGLTVVAIGAGGIKSSVGAHVGDQLDPADNQLMSRAFEWFYVSINVGAALSYLVVPWVAGNYGYEWGFGLPGILMGMATLVFWIGRNKFKQLPPSGINRDNFISISFSAIKKGWKGAKLQYNPVKVEDVKSVWQTLLLFTFIPFFWSAYDQHATLWVQQAESLDLNVNLGFGTVHLDPSQVPVLNPLLILILVPLFSKFFYPWLLKKGFNTTPRNKMLSGFGVGLFCYSVVSVIQVSIDAGGQPSVLWQFLALTLLTISEILIYGTGLEYSYRLAPKTMKSTIMGFWLLTIAGGNLLTVLINHNIKSGGILSFLEGANYYWFFTALIAFATIGFYFTSKKIVQL